MSGTETPLQMAERHVSEGEMRVAHQEAILAELVRDGHTGRTVENAKLTLQTLRHSLEVAHEGVRRERQRAGLQP